MAERPGTMIYFDDIIPLLDVIGEGEAGRLLKAIVYYGKHGELPDFSDVPSLLVAWGFIKPKIDRDAEKYRQEIQRRKYATYCREAKRHGEDPVPFNEWSRLISDDIKRHPTVTAEANETASGTATENGTPAENANKIGKGKGSRGKPKIPPLPDNYETIRQSWKPK